MEPMAESVKWGIWEDACVSTWKRSNKTGLSRENGLGAFQKQRGKTARSGVRGDNRQEHGSASRNSHVEPNQTILPPSTLPGENLHFTVNISEELLTGFAI